MWLFGGQLWGNSTAPQKPRLLEQVRIACRQKHYSPKTEKSYVFWIRQFILFHNKRHQNECMTLRVKDIDFDLRSLTVRAAKGNKDRATILPASLIHELRNHLTKVAQLHKTDLLQGNGHAPMPNALYRKYPSASKSLSWQFVFPSTTVRPWLDTGQMARWHASPSTLRRAFKQAAMKAKIYKHVGPHTLRHAFASHMLAAGTDIRTIQTLLGHKNIETTMIYTHITPDHKNVCSPLDQIKGGGYDN